MKYYTNVLAQGKSHAHAPCVDWDIAPWPEAVTTAQLLDQIAAPSSPHGVLRTDGSTVIGLRTLYDAQNSPLPSDRISPAIRMPGGSGDMIRHIRLAATLFGSEKPAESALWRCRGSKQGPNRARGTISDRGDSSAVDCKFNQWPAAFEMRVPWLALESQQQLGPGTDSAKHPMPVSFKLTGWSSNKQPNQHPGTKHTVGSINGTLVSYIPIKGRIAVLKPVLDKISIAYFIDDPDLLGAVYDGLKHDVADGKFKNAPQFKTGAVKYKASVNLIVSGEPILIQAGPTKKGIAHNFRLEFNPHKLSGPGIAVLKDELESLIGEGLTYTDIITKGQVTRLDIAVDLVGVRIDDLDIRISDKGKSHWYHSPRGEAETGYFGLKKANAPWKAYNKRRQFKETGSGQEAQLYGGLSHTRLEFHAIPKKAVPALVGIKNPFANISIAVATAPKGVEPHEWQFFLDSCQRRGHDAAIAKLLNDKTKKSYVGALNAAHEAFWKPNLIWNSWGETLATLMVTKS
jgi:hypothetical protein